LIPTFVADATAYVRFDSLGLHPEIFSLHLFGRELALRWYSVAYIAGILVGWWYLLKLIAQPGAPMARRHADDMVFYATLGILIGGRVAYVLFYEPSILRSPLGIFKLWEGGMSFHGGVLGVTCGILWLARKNQLNWLRIHDYVACCVPFGLFFGRIANFINGELWGRPTTVPWAIIFPRAGGEPRHPSQLYEAGLEGIVLFTILALLFWKTKARYEPGKLVGTFLVGYGLSRFAMEYFREPDRQLGTLSWGLTMGQTLTVPMLVGGVYLIVTAKGRRTRVEPIAGSETVA